MSGTATQTVSTIPAGETALEAIHRCLNEIESLVGITTLQGSRIRILTNDARQALGQMAMEHAITDNLLTEALADLQAANEGS